MADVELINPVLGTRPFVLIECEPGDTDPGFDMGVRAGGGVETKDEIVVLLLLLVEQLTGVDADLYIKQIDVTRKAAGLKALSAVITEG